MPTRKSAPQTKDSSKPTAAPHGPSEGQDKPAQRKPAAKATKAPAKTQTAAPRKPGGAAASGRPHKSLKEATARAALFVTEYVKDFNGKQAAIRAGYSPRSAEQQASRLLRSAKVVTLLAPFNRAQEAAEASVVKAMELTVDRTRREIARIAYFDPRKMFAADGRPLGIHELDDDTAAVIAGLEVVEAYEGTGPDRVMVGHIKKWKLADKNSALDKAAKILGDYEKDNKQKDQGTADALRGLFSALHDGSARLPIARNPLVKP
jgi:phage terminase small subunit